MIFGRPPSVSKDNGCTRELKCSTLWCDCVRQCRSGRLWSRQSTQTQWHPYITFRERHKPKINHGWNSSATLSSSLVRVSATIIWSKENLRAPWYIKTHESKSMIHSWIAYLKNTCVLKSSYLQIDGSFFKALQIRSQAVHSSTDILPPTDNSPLVKYSNNVKYSRPL